MLVEKKGLTGFEEEHVIGTYSANITKGLNSSEKKILKKYFNKKGTLLDVGCGVGREAREFAKYGHEVWGVDISRNMIEKAKSLNKDLNIHFDNTECMYKYNFEDQSFDYIFVSKGVINHLVDYNKRIKFLFELKRLIKKEGIIVLGINCYDMPLFFQLFLYSIKISQSFKYTLSRYRLFFKSLLLKKHFSSIVGPEIYANSVVPYYLYRLSYIENDFKKVFDKFKLISYIEIQHEIQLLRYIQKGVPTIFAIVEKI
ncbi:MAG: class I SAM-dependent methyltransferase [Halanaerobiales bacterium]|nr:class I SAM-dependent methyltransferase [Halanaerobiales bacterium]